MWHKGPCDCGLFDVLAKYKDECGGELPAELTDPRRGLVPDEAG